MLVARSDQAQHTESTSCNAGKNGAGAGRATSAVLPEEWVHDCALRPRTQSRHLNYLKIAFQDFFEVQVVTLFCSSLGRYRCLLQPYVHAGLPQSVRLPVLQAFLCLSRKEHSTKPAAALSRRN